MIALQERPAERGRPGHAAAASLEPFVGRAEPLAQLHALWLDATRGQGGAVLVRGEPGIGKSRLVWRFASAVRASGGRTLLIRAPSEAGAPALWPFIQLLRRLLGEGLTSADELAPFAGVFAPFLPELRARRPARTPEAPEPESRFWLFDGVTQVLHAAARRAPLCVLLEDVHALDAASLELARYLLRELHAAPWLLVTTSRELDAQAEHPPELLELADAMPCTLRLSGLSEGEVFELLRARLGGVAARAAAREVHRRTEGNPLYVNALVPGLAALGPERLAREVARGVLRLPASLQHAVARRLLRLPEPCRNALRAAAMLGREVDAELLADMLGSGGAERVTPALQSACREGVLQLVPGDGVHYRFTHALLVEVLHDELPASERARLHAAAAAALERRGADRDPTSSGRVARHWLAAGGAVGLARALELSERGARAAFARRAHAEAAEELGVALSALAQLQQVLDGAARLELQRRRAALLRQLSAARFAGGELNTAREHLREVATIARALGDAELLAHAALDGLGRDSYLEVPAEQLALCEESCAALPEDASPTRVRLLAAIAVRLCGTPERTRAARLLDEAERLSPASEDCEAQLAVFEARHLLMLGAKPLEARGELLAHWNASAERQPSSRERLRVMLWRVLYHMEACDGAGMDRLIHAFGRVARASCDPWPIWESLWLMGSRALLSGRLAEAEGLAHSALEMGQRAQAADAAGLFGLQLIQLRRLQGRGEEIVRAVQLSAERHAHLPALRALLAGMYAELGFAAEARTELARAHRECLDALDRLPALHPLGQLAHACAALGDAARARELYPVLLPFEARSAAMVTGVVCDGSLAHHLGLLARATGMPDRAAAHFETALAANGRLGATPWVARTQYELARLLHEGACDAPRALSLASEALAASERIGMRGLAACARSLCETLRAAARPGPAARPHVTRNAQFRREGEHWTLSYEDRSVRLRDSKGMQYIALLLARPSQALHVLDLIAEVYGVAEPDAAQARDLSDAMVARNGEAPEPAIDGASVRAYRARAAELAQELDDARRRSDLGAIDARERELALLRAELIARLHPRHRSTERARKAVYNRIREALARIAREHEALGRHLTASIRTGASCEYRPERDPRWQTS